MPGHHVAMMKHWGNLFVNAILVGRVTAGTVVRRQSVAATRTVEIMRFASTEYVDVNRDSKETFQICKHC